MSQATALTAAPMKGIAAMIAGAALLSMNDAACKHLAEVYPVGQVLCFRQAASPAAGRCGTTTQSRSFTTPCAARRGKPARPRRRFR